MRYISYFLVTVFLVSCSKDTFNTDFVEWDKTPYVFPKLPNFPPPKLSAENPLTLSKVALGKRLFYEKKLSLDNTISCSSCHQPEHGFSDPRKLSLGVDDSEGKRQSMATFNLAFAGEEGFFWDGRARTLKEQVLMPIQDHLEMKETLEGVIKKLSEDESYKNDFIRAFGDHKISSERIALALESFLLTIVSANSKYDKYLEGTATLSESEERGRVLFFKEYNPHFPTESGADCAHCHSGPNFEGRRHSNNGLTQGNNGVGDLGLESFTKNAGDRRKFKITSLRNISLTAPYMHDGRFETLKEAIEHYNTGIKGSPTLDPALRQVHQNGGLKLSDQNIEDLVNFLKTLTDESLAKNPEYLP